LVLEAEEMTHIILRIIFLSVGLLLIGVAIFRLVRLPQPEGRSLKELYQDSERLDSIMTWNFIGTLFCWIGVLLYFFFK
jgi:hypothetical protein